MKFSRFPASRSPGRQRGFTIMELMTVMAIVGILLAIGLPSFRILLGNMRIEAETARFVAAINAARSEAITSGRTVIITATAPVADNEWGGGLEVWRDGDKTHDTTITTTGTDPLDVVVGSLEAMRPVFNSTTNQSTYVFRASGLTTLAAQDTVTVCDDRTGETGRTITILVSGIVSVTTLTCP